MPATYSHHRSNTSAVLLIAFELGWTKWRLAFATGIGNTTWRKTVPARDLDALTREIKRAKKGFGLADETSVVSCYEAGRDGWSNRSQSMSSSSNQRTSTYSPLTSGGNHGCCHSIGTPKVVTDAVRWRLQRLRAVLEMLSLSALAT